MHEERRLYKCDRPHYTRNGKQSTHTHTHDPHTHSRERVRNESSRSGASAKEDREKQRGREKKRREKIRFRLYGCANNNTQHTTKNQQHKCVEAVCVFRRVCRF